MTNTNTQGEGPELVAARMFREYGKEVAYARALRHETDAAEFGIDSPAFWQDVASLIDAMSPCAHECGRPGVGFYNDVFACEACGERILGGMR